MKVEGTMTHPEGQERPERTSVFHNLSAFKAVDPVRSQHGPVHTREMCRAELITKLPLQVSLHMSG